MFDGRLLSGVSVFAAVVQSGTFIRAGEALGMTKSGISRAIARLEARLDLRLFERNSRAVRLTDDGRRFYEQMAPLLTGFEDVANRAADRRNRISGRVRVNVDSTFGHYLLAPHLPGFLVRYPSVSLELMVRDRLGDLIADGFDIACRFDGNETATAGVTPVVDAVLCTCASPDYLAKAGTPHMIAELGSGGFDLLHGGEASAGRSQEWIYRRDEEVCVVEAPRRMLANNMNLLTEAMLAGTGIGRLPDFIAAPHLRDGSLVELFADWTGAGLRGNLFHPARTPPSAALRAFVSFVVETATAIDTDCRPVALLRLANG
jgi:DNA-binding transcriptional LysR family regulator